MERWSVRYRSFCGRARVLLRLGVNDGGANVIYFMSNRMIDCEVRVSANDG